MIECPIHKVAKTDRISGNECQSCELYGEPECLMNVYDDAQQKHLKVDADVWVKVWGILMRRLGKKVKEKTNVEKTRNNP